MMSPLLVFINVVLSRVSSHRSTGNQCTVILKNIYRSPTFHKSMIMSDRLN